MIFSNNGVNRSIHNLSQEEVSDYQRLQELTVRSKPSKVQGALYNKLAGPVVLLLWGVIVNSVEYLELCEFGIYIPPLLGKTFPFVNYRR